MPTLIDDINKKVEGTKEIKIEFLTKKQKNMISNELENLKDLAKRKELKSFRGHGRFEDLKTTRDIAGYKKEQIKEILKGVKVNGSEQEKHKEILEKNIFQIIDNLTKGINY